MKGWKVSADTGGTFTDCLIESDGGEVRQGKVLSSGHLRTLVRRIIHGSALEVDSMTVPEGLDLAGRAVWIGGHPAGVLRSLEAGRLVLEAPPAGVREGDVIEVDSGLEAPVLAMRMLLPELEGTPASSLAFRLGTTRGTNALLERKGAPTALFLTAGFEDLLLIRDQKRPELFAREIVRPAPLYSRVYGIGGRLDADGREESPLDLSGLGSAAREALEAGCAVAAVCFLNSWKNPAHEHEAGSILAACGFSTVRLSSGIRPLIKYLDRTGTTLVDATLGPVMDTYLDRVHNALHGAPLWIMTSGGGLVSRDRFHAVDSLVSGPAGGLLGAVAAGRRAGFDRIIGLDMGGTSTDVSRWKQSVALRQQITVGDARILTPAMPIETVAAGGGSICGYDGERLLVGPESAGADPGPAAYGAGGPLTLTDIHLLLGRIDPDAFTIPIRREAALEALEQVAEAAGESGWQPLAEGFLAIATERMAHAIRRVSLREGENPADYALVAFGGAGGLHACRVADELNMARILFPAEAGILSARGIHDAPRQAVVERQLIGPLEDSGGALEAAFKDLEAGALARLRRDGVGAEDAGGPDRTVFLRLLGQEAGIPVSWRPGGDLKAGFRAEFVAIFGYFPEDARVETVKLRVVMTERRENPDTETFAAGADRAEPAGRIDGFVAGRAESIPVFEREGAAPGSRIPGPAVIRDPFGTCFIEPGWEGVRGSRGSVLVHRLEAASSDAPVDTGNVEKTLVINRLEALVEEMGDQLRRTALSTNIRERLDFSCALLDGEGRLLVNAPHIPVHLGAMGLCVRECLKTRDFRPGDVLVTNHPAFGGSHLPDITLVTGLFDGSGRRMGFLANRAHHAELGGISPGSMPADARSLLEEGVILPPQWLLRDGRDRFAAIEAALSGGPYPSRAARENRIDLEAQLASLRRGTAMFAALLGDYPAATLRRRFGDLYRMAADAMDRLLAGPALTACTAERRLDDGHAIRIAVAPGKGRLCIDFSGTDPRHRGNLNATPAIVRSAVLYVLRLLVDQPLPLNEGLLDKVSIRLPRCFLNPDFPEDPARCPAVVGGNVETSQCLVEALVAALGLLAGSQGTMNNLLFGNDRFGYYETIGGGAGAGGGFAGASGVHVHMTNTAITDPEILEQRFPVSCREFSLRRGSGGKGRWTGGDGLVREIRFRQPVTVSLLAQGRRDGPAGMAGGHDGRPGRQFVRRRDGGLEELPGMARVDLSPGEGIRIETPGGGGWGG